MRSDGRRPDELRSTTIVRDYIKYAEGSVLIEVGDTRVICTASVEDKVPPFLRGTGHGWITAEYAMIPRATAARNQRDATRGRQSGRSYEIQRLIGRALRSVTDLSLIGERTIWIDCDVIQADGGTRTAAITGGFVALADALARLGRDEGWPQFPVIDLLAATSVGIVGGQPMLDLRFDEDSKAQVDMNVVMTGSGKIVEIQGTAENGPFSKEELDELLALARTGILQLIKIQKQALPDPVVNSIGGTKRGTVTPRIEE